LRTIRTVDPARGGLARDGLGHLIGAQGAGGGVAGT
jgi:hypothetical protein